MDERSISVIVDEVVRKLREGNSGAPSGAPAAQGSGLSGVFATVDEAVNAAAAAFEQYGSVSLEQRKKAIDAIRTTTHQIKDHVARATVEETGIGRADHKVLKLGMAADMTPGVEDLAPRHCWSGDNGLTVEEYAPFGVISAATPVTHPVPTMINNGISMLAGGNTVVFSPHPGSKRIFAWALDKFNRAIEAATGFRNLMTCVAEPTIETTKQAFVHPKVRLLLVTGGPGVVREALSTPKKAITAGPGNPPVVVDETAVIPKAAEFIIAGAAFDNNVLCIAEKEVFVVDSVADQLIAEMKKIGCVQLSPDQTAALAQQAFKCKGTHGSATGCGGTTLNRDLVGKRASVLAQSIGLSVPEDTPMLIGETEFDNPWVQHEQMMCFLPIVRCRNADEAVDMAHKAEHGYGHTAMVHSLNVALLTKMGRLMNCSLYVKNGPSFAALGNGGEGFTSYSIASPTGEGVTTARTFCRIRRCTMKDYLRIV